MPSAAKETTDQEQLLLSFASPNLVNISSDPSLSMKKRSSMMAADAASMLACKHAIAS